MIAYEMKMQHRESDLPCNNTTIIVLRVQREKSQTRLYMIAIFTSDIVRAASTTVHATSTTPCCQ